MTFFIAFLAVLSVLAVFGLVRMIHGDRPRQAPRGPSYWSGDLPAGPFSTAR
jgi:hypothetical protein